jgi:hemoglobin
MPPDESLIVQHVDEAAFTRLVAAFYRRVQEDDLIGPMYPPDDWDGARDRLAGFLRFRFHGNPAYIEARGHPRLRGRHLPFAIGVAERDRWMELMTEAMAETAVAPAAMAPLRDFFAQVADFMRNQPA